MYTIKAYIREWMVQSILSQLQKPNMTGFGSPCGACKSLRRKCTKDCVFAPYFCNEQGAAQFAAIHKVFGASNVSKLLMHLPIPDRGDAAVTISYEAQARLQNPIHGCVAHIFALQQEVINLQAQLASLKASHGHVNASLTLEQKPYDSFASFQHCGEEYFHDARMPEPLLRPPSIHTSLYYKDGLRDSSCIQSTDQNFCRSNSSLIGMEDDMEELVSVVSGNLNH